ncbi:MAG: low molecular weight protein-tyrosine phosphatase [Frankiaceae bacterium]|nr:low molecular weight protein-tyrosine phosphatase [Frankiaceae bacterium]
MTIIEDDPATASAVTVGGDMTVLRLLFVCTGNICRSPSAEYLLRARLRSMLGDDGDCFALSSAGVGTPGGWELDPKIAQLLTGVGIDPDGQFRSRRVDAAVLGDADLILTGTKQHRLAIGADFPEAYSRTFTMREAAALFASPETAALPRHDLVQRGQAAVALLQRARSTRALRDDEVDIADPYGRRTSEYQTMFREVASVVDVLSFVLAPATARSWKRRN